MQKIYVFMGVAGSGKDFTARTVMGENGAAKVAFADPLREDIWTLIGWKPKNDKEYDDFKSTVFTSPLGISFTGRDLLLNYGTEIRRKEDTHHWCKMGVQDIAQVLSFTPAVVITDCRFENEIEYLKLLAKKISVDIEFIFCNYISDRYDDTIDHESERLAQDFLSMGFTHLDPTFDQFVKETRFAHVPEIKNIHSK